jgi:hypothetical protein
MSDSETNLLKFELGISNDLASLLYLPLVSGDNNFICRSLAEIITLSAARQLVRSDILAFSIQHILLTFEKKLVFETNRKCVRLYDYTGIKKTS